MSSGNLAPKIHTNLVVSACISFLTQMRRFRKGNLRKCCQFPFSSYRRACRLRSASDKSAAFLILACSHKDAVAYLSEQKARSTVNMMASRSDCLPYRLAISFPICLILSGKKQAYNTMRPETITQTIQKQCNCVTDVRALGQLPFETLGLQYEFP